jgi:hypothetical protein
MGNGKAIDTVADAPMSDKELIQLLTLAAKELNRRLESGSGFCRAAAKVDSKAGDVVNVEPVDPNTELCNALFATSAATQAAIIANGCAGA